MSNLVIEGRLVQLLEEQSGQGKTGNVWKKGGIVLETEGSQYPKKIALTVWGEKCDQVKTFRPGEKLSCAIDVESREYNGRWYTDVKAWKIDVVSATNTASDMGAYAAAPAVDPFAGDQGVDDLPF